MTMTLLTRAKKTVATVIVALDGTGDTTDIQTGIDLLPAGGGVVYIKEGTYTITAPITIISDNVAIIGSGYGTIIYLANGSNCNMIEVGDGINQYSSIILSRFALDGNKANQGAGNWDGIYFNTRIIISMIDRIYIFDCKRDGIYIGIQSIANLITNNYVYNNDGAGIEMNFCWMNNISQNTLLTNFGHGIYFHDSCSQNKVNDNTLNDNRTHSVYLIESEREIINANTIMTSDEKGIYLNDCTYVAITSNEVWANGTDGIFIDADSDFNNISSNIVYLNTGTGILINAANCDKNIVVSNICRNNTAAQFTDNGTATEVGHNITT